MVDGFISQINEEYAVKTVESAKDNRSIFIDISSDALPTLSAHYVDGKLYSVSFLNNEYFELPEEDLKLIIRDLLEGKYVIKKSFFGKKSIAIVKEDGKHILPERRAKWAKAAEAQYKALPRQFPKK